MVKKPQNLSTPIIITLRDRWDESGWENWNQRMNRGMCEQDDPKLMDDFEYIPIQHLSQNENV